HRRPSPGRPAGLSSNRLARVSWRARPRLSPGRSRICWGRRSRASFLPWWPADRWPPACSGSARPRSRGGGARPWAIGSAPAPGEHRPLHAVGTAVIAELLWLCRAAIADARQAGQTDYVQVIQNWGAQAGARTNHLCLDLYDLPQVPHRVAEEIGGAARYVIREGKCPWCRALREEPAGERLIYEDPDTVAYAPYASRSPFEVWVVPRRHEADFGRASDAAVAATAEGLRQVLGRLATLDGPPYNLVLHTGPLREQVESTYHWHWDIHPRLRDIAGLELGTGLPVNPVSPEDAVDELLRQTVAPQVASSG